MAVLIPFFELGERVGHRVEIEAGTLKELVDVGIARFGSPFADAVKVSTFVINGRANTALKGKRTPLGSEDTIWMVRPAAGG